jgi:hypothetical protein
MLEWLRNILRRWLLGEPEKSSKWLECVVVRKGISEKKDYYIVGSAGMNLIGKPLGEEGEHQTLIRHLEAVDGNKFWELWREYNSDVSFEWEESEADACRKKQ